MTLELLPEDYIAKALQDARRFSGTYDHGTSGSLAAHTHRLINERKTLLSTIKDLEDRNAELRAAVARRLAGGQQIPEAVLNLHPGATIVPAEPTQPAQFTPACLSSSMPPEQAQAAWDAIKAKSAAVRSGPRDFKDVRVKPLEPPALRLIGVAGRAGSGKNAIAAMIPGATVVQLADPIYAALAVILGVPETVLRKQDYKASVLADLGKTPRQMLQTLGTEWGRQMVADDIWIRMAERRINRLEAAGALTIVIADVRFDNEAEWIRGRGGSVWHVDRDGVGSDSHVSESGVTRHPDDVVIHNTGTLDDLRRSVNAAFAP